MSTYVGSRGSLDEAVFLERADGDSQIVVDTETLAGVRLGVVESSAQVDGYSTLESFPGSQNGASACPAKTAQNGGINHLE